MVHVMIFTGKISARNDWLGNKGAMTAAGGEPVSRYRRYQENGSDHGIFNGDLSWKYTLWLFNIAMENGPFIDGLPIENGDFP